MIDITHFSYEAIWLWLVAFCIIEFPCIYMFKNLLGKPSTYLTKYYSFTYFNIINVMIGDIIYVLIGLIIAYRIHSYVCKDVTDFNKRFICLLLIFWLVQMAGDFTFYNIVRVLSKSSDSKWINFFVDYGNHSKAAAIFGDSLYILILSLMVYFVRYIPSDICLGIVFTFIFICSAIAEQK